MTTTARATTTAGATTTTRRAGGLALALLCASAAAPAAAGAHGEASPLIRSVVEKVEPRISGVTFTPVRGPAALVRVVNRTDEDVEILSIDGEPFLRVGPRGVFGNTRSPAWFESGNPDGQGVPGLRPGGKPRWRLFGRRPAWEYYEHRLHPSTVAVPRSVRDEREPVRLRGFSVPFRHGGRAAKVVGRVEFRPVLGRFAAELQSSAQPLPGVSVTLLPGSHPGLLVQNTSGRPIVVGGSEGEPYARIGPRGVHVNQRSPQHVEDLQRQGRLPRVAADARARPLWRRVQTVPSFTWIEPRAAYEREQPPDAALRGDEPVRLVGWRVPVSGAGRRAEIRGTTTWVPTGASGLPRKEAADEDGGGLAAGPAIALGALLALAFGFAVRLRTRSGRTAA